ncbi:MAG: alanine racemase [Myxococcales bacterium]|nr:alanine racemase [Myxococcales bacterium]
MDWSYSALARIVADQPLPAMIVDLSRFDANVRRVASRLAERGKALRIATKSLRVPALIERAASLADSRRLMCFALDEACFLAEEGFDDLLVAYPIVQSAELARARELTERGVRLTLMVDSIDHLDRIDATGGEGWRVCVDVDVSYRIAGRHLGAQRSPLRTLAAVQQLIGAIERRPALQLVGVMGYEAHIAGFPEQNPFSAWLNPVKQRLKRRFVEQTRAKRDAIGAWLASRGIELEFFNGGGSGSLDSTSIERAVDEVTVGSGFLQSHLFDYYAQNRSEPAFAFALAVTRRPEERFVTCQSGGFIASGEIGPDKAPLPIAPDGVSPTKGEGFGEVQTPLEIRRGSEAERLRLGDPVFFRPAKAGEIAERFSHYLLVDGESIVNRVPTYRGLGKSFF